MINYPPPTLIARFNQAIVRHFIEALSFMQSLPNMVVGGPDLSIPVYPVYESLNFSGPLVTVKFRRGAFGFDPGENYQGYDSINQLKQFGIHIPRSQMICTVYARLAGECAYFEDCLESGIMTNYATNPITGDDMDGATIRYLAETAIVVNGVGEVVEIESRPEDPRPFAQMWSMMVPFDVMVDIMWQGTPNTVNTMNIEIDTYSNDGTLILDKQIINPSDL